jgi:hypothetical protein
MNTIETERERFKRLSENVDLGCVIIMPFIATAVIHFAPWWIYVPVAFSCCWMFLGACASIRSNGR